MPLADKNEPAVALEHPNGVVFETANGTARVSVFVSEMAIDQIESPPPIRDRQGHLDHFAKHRANFVTIASRKFDKGETETDGSVRLLQHDLP